MDELILFLVGLALDLRDELRAKGEFEKADVIRSHFVKAGIKIRDESIKK